MNISWVVPPAHLHPAPECASHLPTISHALCSDENDRLYPSPPKKPIAPSYFFAKEKSWTSHKNEVKNKSTVEEIRMPKISASQPISRFPTPLKTSQRNTKPPNRKPWRKKCHSEKNAKSGSQNQRENRKRYQRSTMTRSRRPMQRTLTTLSCPGATKKIDYARNIEIEGEPNHDIEQSERVMWKAAIQNGSFKK